MELREYLSILRRRWVQIVGIALLTTIVAMIVGFLTPARWESTTTLRVAPSGSPTTPYEQRLTADMLAKTYRELINSDYVATKAMELLFIDDPVERFKRDIQVTLVPDTELIQITAAGRTPERARAKAAAVADAALAYVKSRGMGDQVGIAIPALLPDRASWPNPSVIGAAGLGFGLALGVAMAFLFDYLGARVDKPSDLEEKANLPVIGQIPRLAALGPHPNVFAEPNSPQAEHFRHLRTAILYAMDGQRLDALLVTSAEPQQGKTVVAANLAVALAKTGKRVLLVDADMRVPSVHSFFNIANERGLSDLLRGDLAAEDVTQPSGYDSLTLITAGSRPDEPSELLGSMKMNDLLRYARSVADVTVIDAPPALTVTDSVVLAARADGVVLVVDRLQRLDTVRRAKALLGAVGAHIVGSVLNNVELDRVSAKSGYYTARREPPSDQTGTGAS